MNMATQERVSEQERDSSQRFNMYQSVHKGLRAFMADTLTKVGRTDYTDAAECEETASQLRSLLHICAEHLAHENRFVHSAMEGRAKGSAARCAEEHIEHVAHIASLNDCLDHAMQVAAREQARTWQQLYQSLSLFVADNYEHMLIEERDHNTVLWHHFSDEELIELHDALLASVPADEMAIHLRWMLPQLSHPERVGMLSGMRQGMPPEVFVSQLSLVKPLLDERSWLKLTDALASGGAQHV